MVPEADIQIGPDQQKMTYTVTSENGYNQTYMMMSPKSLDQNTIINTLISDPNHKGKKTLAPYLRGGGAGQRRIQPAGAAQPGQ